jgi:hypothetical protein
MAKKPKLYVELYYGRLTPDSEPIETAEAGGTMLIGPFDVFVTTYAFTIRMLYKKQGYTFAMHEDMIFVNNIYYSDWAIYSGRPDWLENHPEIPIINFPDAIKKGYITEF